MRKKELELENKTHDSMMHFATTTATATTKTISILSSHGNGNDVQIWSKIMYLFTILLKAYFLMHLKF
jgi:hypothetical protein